MCMCVCGCAHMCVLVCVVEARDKAGGLPQSLSTLFFETRPLAEPRPPLTQLELLTSEPQGLPVSVSLTLEHHHAWLLHV